MKKRDIVYILRNDMGSDAEELRYSLRSVAENFPARNVWFVGGQLVHRECSVCGDARYIDDREYFVTDNFCPNCGADMRGGEDGK